jgi:hypothetical protein
MCALRVGNLSLYRHITTEGDHFHQTIVAPKESFEFLFVRVQTPRYVANNVGTSIEHSSLLPIRLSR